MSLNLRASTKANKFINRSKKPSKYSLALKNAVVGACKAGLSHSAAAEKYGINNKSTVTKWCFIVDSGRILNDFDGRPSEFSSEDKASFVETVNTTTTDQYAMRQSVAKDIMIQKIQENRKKRGLDMEIHSEPSVKTISNIFKSVDAHCVVADSTTTARRDAEANVNNAIGFCAGISAIMRYIDSRMMGNVDASQFVYEEKTEKRVYCGNWKDYVGKKANVKGEPNTNDEGGLGFGIKFYCQIISAGMMGSPIYIIADSNMSEDDIDVYTMKNFGIGVSPGRASYLVFMQTRVPGPKFYRWFIKDYLIPFVESIRALS